TRSYRAGPSPCQARPRRSGSWARLDSVTLRLDRGGLQACRQRDGKAAAFAKRALDADVSAVCFDDVARDCEAESAALGVVDQRRAGAIEAVEDPLLLGGRDADAAVGDANQHVGASA